MQRRGFLRLLGGAAAVVPLVGIAAPIAPAAPESVSLEAIHDETYVYAARGLYTPAWTTTITAGTKEISNYSRNATLTMGSFYSFDDSGKPIRLAEERA